MKSNNYCKLNNKEHFGNIPFNKKFEIGELNINFEFNIETALFQYKNYSKIRLETILVHNSR